MVELLITLSEARFVMGAGWPLLCFMSGEGFIIVPLLWTPAPLQLWDLQAVRCVTFSVAQRGQMCGWIWWRNGAGQAVGRVGMGC